MKKITPYKSSDNKKKQVIKMFNNIAKKYDFLNHTLSLGMDYVWRKKALKKITNNPSLILDIATGTADFAIAATKVTKAKIIGIDIAQNMLDIGIDKIEKKKISDRIKLLNADCENLPFEDNKFDAVTAGFGVRNFENLEAGLKEIYRVVKKEGIVTIIEPSTPSNFILKPIYKFYFKYILPIIGRLISKDKSAYSYLPESVEAFPEGDIFIKILEKIGFKDCQKIELSFGIVTLYVAIKS